MTHGGGHTWSRTRKKQLVNDTGKCPYCGWHSGENARGWTKHGKRKPKYKNIDRQTIRGL